MTSSFRARITIDAKENTGAIFDSLNTDNRFHPEDSANTMSGGDAISIDIESGQISHLRANLNSILRLVQAGHDAIESVKV